MKQKLLEQEIEARFNRYIVECKCKSIDKYQRTAEDLIDT